MSVVMGTMLAMMTVVRGDDRKGALLCRSDGAFHCAGNSPSIIVADNGYLVQIS